MRRALIITASVIVLIGLAVALYFLFFAAKAPKLTVGGTFTENPANTTGGSGPIVTGNSAGTEVAPHLIKITDGPVVPSVSVFTVQNPNTGTTSANTGTPAAPVIDTAVRYIDRASGNIYEYRATARTLSRLSNKTLPGIEEAAWMSDGSTAFVRFLSKDGSGTEQTATYALPADGNGGYFLESGLDEVRTYATSTLFSLLSGTTGSVGTLAKPDGSAVRTVFSSLLSALIVQPSNGVLFATTKASAGTNGYAFSVDEKTGVFTRMLGPLTGLSVLPSPSGKLVLFSYVSGGALHMSVLNVATKLATDLPVPTLTEKCAWAADSLSVYCAVPKSFPRASLPDDWYQGALSFSDRLWKIDMSARVASLIVDPTQVASVDIDAVGLSVDSRSSQLVFTNRADGSLWAYSL